MLQRRLGGSEYAADIDVDHAIHLIQRRLFERFRNCRAGIIHKHIVRPCETVLNRSVLYDDEGAARMQRY